MRDEFYVLDECGIVLENQDGDSRVFQDEGQAHDAAFVYALTIPGEKIKVVQLVKEVIAPVASGMVPHKET